MVHAGILCRHKCNAKFQISKSSNGFLILCQKCRELIKIVQLQKLEERSIVLSAYGVFPATVRGEVLPTLEDIGKQYFVGEVRKMIWRLIEKETGKDDARNRSPYF